MGQRILTADPTLHVDPRLFSIKLGALGGNSLTYVMKLNQSTESCIELRLKCWRYQKLVGSVMDSPLLPKAALSSLASAT